MPLVCTLYRRAGKTALALYWAYQVRDQFPDGQLYVNLRGFDPGGRAMEPAAAVRGFLDALGIAPPRVPADPDAQAALYRSLLADKRMLIVLDNVRDSAQVRPLLPGTPGSLVVVTSRSQLTGLIAASGAHPVTLDLLTRDEARELLDRRIGADRVAAEPEAVAEIITRCARLPLALTLVAAHAAIRPDIGLHSLADELRDSHRRWQTLAGDDPTTDVRAVFSWSYQTLSPAAAHLFRSLGVHPGPDITAPAVASLAGHPPARVAPLLAELTGTNLITEHTPGRYALHDLLRAYATDLAHTTDTDGQRQAARQRLLDHYLHTAHTADGLLLAHPTRTRITVAPPRPGVAPEPLSEPRQAMDWFIAEHAVLLGVVDLAATTESDTHTWQLNSALAVFLYRQGHWHDRVGIGNAAVAAAARLANPTAQADAHFSLADAYLRLGRFDDAQTQLNEALDLYRKTGDRAGQAHIHHGLSFLWEQRGQPPQALHHARESLRLYQAADHQYGQANALGALGWQYAQLGDYPRALSHCRQALTLQQELNNRAGEAHIWDSLGYTQHQLGHHTEAVTCHQRAADLFHDLGDRYNEADALAHLGDAHRGAGDSAAARDAYRRALTIFTDLDHADADAVRARLATLDPT